MLSDPEASRAAPPASRAERVLDPYERLSEVLFGVIMTLTITSSMRVGLAGSEGTRALLAAAIGCNLAWGIVDAVMYVLGNHTERGHRGATLRAVRAAREPEGRRLLADALPDEVRAHLTEDQLEAVRRWLVELPTRAIGPWFCADDLRGALGVFVLVALSTFPVVLPFVFLHDATLAFRVSNAVALVMMIGIGVALGRYSGRRPLLTGLGLGALGVALVLLTIALGG